jgi:septal ring factor EnvC (AmiA/AmiB activator)
LVSPSPTGLRRSRALAALALAAALAAVPAIALRAAPGGPGAQVIDGARAQVRALEGELVRLGDEAAAAAGAHAAAQERVEALRARIRETTAALAEARRAQGIAERRLSDRLVALYVEQPPTLVEVLLSSGGLSEAVETQASLEAISSADGRIVDSLEEARDRLARVRGELLDQREEADAALREAGARLERMEGLLRSRRAVLEQAKTTLDGLVAQERRRREPPAARQERDAAIDAAGRRVEEAVRSRARPRAEPAPSPPAPAGIPGAPEQSVLDRIADCESGGNPRAVSASGQYRGKYQFDQGTWEGVGGTGDPAAASEAEQDRRAAMLYARSGPAPWPVCGYR